MATLAIEEERKTIANDIHDHLNAAVIVAKLEAGRIALLAGKEITAERIAEVEARAHSIVQGMSGLYEMGRDMVRRLRPEIIDTLGLRDAVEEMVRNLDRLHRQCRFEFAAVGDLSVLDGELAIAAYRLVQEALSNVVKHAEASEATVRLEQRDNALHISIDDNGKGFDKEAVQLGIGLIAMRERVLGLGGGTWRSVPRPGRAHRL